MLSRFAAAIVLVAIMVIPANSEGDQDGNQGTNALNQVGGLYPTPFDLSSCNGRRVFERRLRRPHMRRGKWLCGGEHRIQDRREHQNERHTDHDHKLSEKSRGQKDPMVYYRLKEDTRTGNLRAVQLLLGHTKIESTVKYLGIEVDDALDIAEKVDI